MNKEKLNYPSPQYAKTDLKIQLLEFLHQGILVPLQCQSRRRQFWRLRFLSYASRTDPSRYI